MKNIILLHYLLFLPVFAFSGEWLIGDRPEWVQHSRNIEYSGASTDSRNGVIFHRYERQINAEEGPEEYIRIVVEITGQQGVEDYGQLYLDYDPDFQDLVLHSVTVYRDGEAVDKLEDADMQALQREENLDYLMYDGSMTLSVVLKDLRVGDMLEYDFSYQGRNPVFRNYLFDFFNLNWDIPIRSQLIRILYDPDRQIHVNANNTDDSFDRGEEGGMAVLVWEGENLRPVLSNSETPSWYPVHDVMDVSSFNEWSQLSDLIVPLFEEAAENSSQTFLEADRITENLDSQKEKATALIDFVQNNIRYLGYEMGENSYRPHDCDVTLEHRFGDCKDKSLLLSVMLNHVGIEACPVLVNTVDYHTIADFLPNPLLFNHAIVRLTIDGQDYWIDPTRSRQGGDIDKIYQPAYGKAFPVLADQNRLVDMPQDDSKQPDVLVQETMDGSDDSKESILLVITELRSYKAEFYRQTLEQEGPEALEKQYLNYLAEYYPDIEVESPLEVEDRYEENLVVIKEHYRIPNYWYWDDEENQWTAELNALAVRDYLYIPEEQKRDAPYWLYHPIYVKYRMEASFPDQDWELDPETIEIDNDNFRFNHQFDFDNKTNIATMEYEYQTKRDYVPEDDIRVFVDDVNDAWTYCGWIFFYDPDYVVLKEDDDSDPTGFILFLVALVGFGLLSLGFYFFNKTKSRRNSARYMEERGE